jgi:hypothetical protein
MKRVTIILLMLVTALLLGAWEARGEGSPTKFVGAKVVLVDEAGNPIPESKLPEKFLFLLKCKTISNASTPLLRFAKNWSGQSGNPYKDTELNTGGEFNGGLKDEKNKNKKPVNLADIHDFEFNVENYWYTAPIEGNPPYFVVGIQMVVYTAGSTTTELLSYSVSREKLQESKFFCVFRQASIPELRNPNNNEKLKNKGDVELVVKFTLQRHSGDICTVTRGTDCPLGSVFPLYPTYKRNENWYSGKEEDHEKLKPPDSWNVTAGGKSFKVWRGTYILYEHTNAPGYEFKHVSKCSPTVKGVQKVSGQVTGSGNWWIDEICSNTVIRKTGGSIPQFTVNYNANYAEGGREFVIAVTDDKGNPVPPGSSVYEGAGIKISAMLKHPSGCTKVEKVLVKRNGVDDPVSLDDDGNGQYGVIANITKIVPVVTERKYKVAWTATSAPLIKEIHTGTPSGTLVANGDQVSCDAKLYLKVNGKAKKVEAKYKGGVQQVLTPEGEFFTINPAEDIEDFLITLTPKFKVEFSPLTYGTLSVVASESGSVNSGNEVYDGEVLTITATLQPPLQVQEIEVTTGDDQIHPYPLSGGAISIQHTITQAVKAITVQYTPAVYEVNGIAPGVDVKAVGGRVWNGSSFAEASVSAPISVPNGSKVIAGTKLRLSTSDPSVKRFVWKIAGVSATKPVVLAPVEFEVTGNVEEITTSTEDVKLAVNYTQDQGIGLKLVLHEGTVYKHDGTLKSTVADTEVEPGEKVGIGSKLKVKVDGASQCKKIKGKVKVTMGGDVLEVDPNVPFTVTKEITKVEVVVESVHYTIKYTENGNSAEGDAPYSLEVFVNPTSPTNNGTPVPTGGSINCGETIRIKPDPKGAKKRILQSLTVKVKGGPDENIYDPANPSGPYDYVPHGDIVDIVAEYVEKTFAVRYTSPDLEVLIGGSLEVAQELAPNVTKTYPGGVHVYVRRKNLRADETADGLLVNDVPVNDGSLKDEDGYYYIVLATDINKLDIPKKSLSPGSVTFDYELKEAGKADVDVEWLLPGRVPRQLFQGVTIQKGAKLRVKLSNFAPGYKYSCITVDGKLLDGVVRASNATDSYDFTVPDVSTYKITVWVVNTQSLTGDRFIRISKTEHGTIQMTDVDATPPHTLGIGEDYPTEPGRRFTVSITPAAGYVKVRDAFEGVHQLHGDEYIVPADPGPGSHFTVWAEFDLSGGKRWPVLWDNAEHGKLEVKFGKRSLEAGESLPEGSTLFVRATPDNSYRVQSFKINGVEFVKSTENNGGIEEKYRVTDTVRILVAFAPVNSRFDRVEDVFGNVVLMPNPVVDGFTVTGASAAVHYQLLTTFGQQILEGNTTEQEQIRVELPALPSGLYLFVLTDAQGRKATLRVVKRQ